MSAPEVRTGRNGNQPAKGGSESHRSGFHPPAAHAKNVADRGERQHNSPKSTPHFGGKTCRRDSDCKLFMGNILADELQVWDWCLIEIRSGPAAFSLTV